MQRFTRPESGPGAAQDTAETEVRPQSEPPPKRRRPQDPPVGDRGQAPVRASAEQVRPQSEPPPSQAAQDTAETEAQAAGASQSETQANLLAELAVSGRVERGAPGFEAWVRGLSLSALEAAFDQTQSSNANFRECQAYLCESLRPPPGQGCPGCPGCPWCRYRQALRYVLVHGRPPLWWSVP